MTDTTEVTKPFAFSDALALESIPDGLKKYLLDEKGKYNAGLQELLVKFATTVAYKVYANIRTGYRMDMSIDPIEYVDCGASTVSHELLAHAIDYLLRPKPAEFSDEQFVALKKLFLETPIPKKVPSDD